MTEKPEPQFLNYLACPFCGKAAHLSVLTDKTFNSYDVDWAVYQFRLPRGGRGHGGFFVGKQGLSIKEMLGNPETKDLAGKLIHRLKLIYNAWKKEGII